MQRLLNRAAKVSGHAAKRAERKKADTFKDEKWAYDYRSKMQNSQIKRFIKDEERNRKEDWATGTRLLARRDVGKNKFGFGTVPTDIVYNPTVPERWRKKTWLASGDRVVVLSGRDRGKIGSVTEVAEDSQSCRVENLNEVNYVVPEFIAQEQGRNYTPTVVTTRLLSWDDVKLVHAVRDQAGYFRDVVVDEVELIGGEGGKKAKRVIPGLKQEIPWPAEEKPEHEDGDSDTLRMTVDENTFVPSLNETPMPGSVIDELRGKYSKFRTRHEPAYIAQKEAEASFLESKAARLEGRGMTPFMRQAALYKAARKTELPELSEEQLASIGLNMMKESPERAARLLKRFEGEQQKEVSA